MWRLTSQTSPLVSEPSASSKLALLFHYLSPSAALSVCLSLSHSLPLYSMRVCSVAQCCPTAWLLCPGDFPGKNTVVGCHFLLQGVFPTQGLNPGLLLLLLFSFSAVCDTFPATWTAACQASLSVTISWTLLKLMSIKSVMPSNHPVLCHPLLLLSSIIPSIRVFSKELALLIRWPKYWNFSFSISPSSEYTGLISFKIDWFDLLAVQGMLKSFL